MGEARKGAAGEEEFVIKREKMGEDVSSVAARYGTDDGPC